MPETKEIRVPDIGDFQDVEIIEVAVSPGDHVEPEQALITIESDKATMDVPSTDAGTVRELHVSVGDKVSEGSLIVTLEAEEARADAQDEGVQGDDEGERDAGEGGDDRDEAPSESPVTSASGGDGAGAEAGDVDLRAEVLVLGSGPGGYTAAFRAADLGKRTVLVERYATLGGVCLNVGCIPSKALLHTAELINGARAMAEHGVRFGDPEIDAARLSAWKDEVVGQLTKGLAGLAKKREVQVVQGTGEFASSHVLVAQTGDGEVRIGFEHAIIAAGSQAASIPGLPEDDPRVMDSTDALALDEIPGRLLVIGGGIIGLEMATVYHALGSKVTVVELMDRLMTGCDQDLVRPLEKRIRKQYEAVYLGTKVSAVEAKKKVLEVRFEGKDAPETARFDRVLVAVGRRPNGGRIGAEAAGVRVDNSGFIPADREQRTNVPHIFAIGDIAGEPLLAHKATHEGKVAAEVAAGHKASFDAMAIPSVAYTDPEVAWTGVTEEQAGREGIDYESATFPWAASGRSLGMGRNEGLTKLLFDKDTKRVIGAGIVGPHAGDLISEANLALEMGADAADLALTIHPHPTLSETVCFAAEMAEGTITDLYAPKRK